MTVQGAVAQFDRWHYPWQFCEQVRRRLLRIPDELQLFDRVYEEASRNEHWMHADLIEGGRIAQDSLEKAFPELDEGTLAQFVRAVSYEKWK
jgi:hypothetical protein